MALLFDFPQPTMIAANGIQLEVFEAGREHAGNPIVLCHGWPEHAYSWRYQIPELVDAGYHVIVPNQRGYGNSSCPTEVTAYDISHLAGDLVALLDHFGYQDAVFVGHDWGACVVWWLTLLHPSRVNKVINLSMSYIERGEKPWVAAIEEMLGDKHYFVHFNRYPGVIDAVLAANTQRFLRNLFRQNVPVAAVPAMLDLIQIAEAEDAEGEPLLGDTELDVFVAAFERVGFTPSINWYRNLDRNWQLLADVNPVIEQPALMIYGERDTVARNQNLAALVPNVTEMSFDCGHWIQQEKPQETTQAILRWLAQQA